MIREDRELLAELGWLNSDVVPFAMKIMDESVTVTAEEQYDFANRLVAMGRRLEQRAHGTADGAVDGVVQEAGVASRDGMERVSPRMRDGEFLGLRKAEFVD